MTDNLKKKVQFVKEISGIIVKVQTNITSISYEVYQSKKNPKWITEFLMINYVGGARTIRNCTGNSCSAIYTEIGKFLNNGYYDEAQYYDDIVAVSSKCYVEE